MNRILSFTILCLVLVTRIAAEPEPHIGMRKDEVKRLFAPYIVSESSTGGITLHMPFFGHEANVYLGFLRSGTVQRIEAAFGGPIEGTVRRNRLDMFRDIRIRLERLRGRSYSYARVNGVDVLGNSGRGGVDEGRRNEFVFGVSSDGLLYQVEISAPTLESLAQEGEMSLTIDREELIKPPT